MAYVLSWVIACECSTVVVLVLRVILIESTGNVAIILFIYLF